jgi:acyl-[acyl-carrier-protein]-phospholipid O-acyltransferase/long-chain-fatty-acid--[acyl-carrier-protein] ligase
MNLLKTRRFLPLFVTQFLGAFNDNLFKNALVMLITYKLAAQAGVNASLLVTLAAGLFMLPYLLFSATAGQLADKYDRAFMARATKIAEIAVMGVGCVGFYLGNPYFLLFVLFCLGTQAAFFGPVKYALLPQHLHENELLSGNAYIEAATFLAILFGTILGGLLIVSVAGTHLVAAAIVGVALLGYGASRYIPAAPGPMPELKIRWNLISETWRIVQHDRKNPKVFRSILAISWFWLVGATFLAQFPNYAKHVINADATVVTLFLTVFSVGIGIGSFGCNALLKGKVSDTLVPYAMLGISLFTVDFYFASGAAAIAPGGELENAWQFMSDSLNWRLLIDLLGISVCGGLYIVPLYAILQHDSDPNFRARTIASNNVLNALFMVFSALASVAMFAAGFTVVHLFLAVGIANTGVGIYLWKTLRARRRI